MAGGDGRSDSTDGSTDGFGADLASDGAEAPGGDASSSDANGDLPGSEAGHDGPSTDAIAADGAPDDGPATVRVSGTAVAHPLTVSLGMNPATDFSQLSVTLADPAVELANPSAPPLATAPLDISVANCSPTAGCLWSFDAVNLDAVTLGLMGVVRDGRAAASRLWIETATFAASADVVNAHKISRQPITNARLFTVSRSTEAKLAQLAAVVLADVTIVPGSLESRGFIVGTIAGRLSQGAPPVAGALVSVLASELRLNVIYPNADFSAAGIATAAHGTFLAVPKSATPPAIVTIFAVTAPAGDVRLWPSWIVETTPGRAFVVPLIADEAP